MVSYTFYPNLPIFLHRYICHICDILQLCAHNWRDGNHLLWEFMFACKRNIFTWTGRTLTLGTLYSWSHTLYYEFATNILSTWIHNFPTKNTVFPQKCTIFVSKIIFFFTATVLLEVQLNTRLPLLKAALSLLSADVNQKMAQWKMRPYQLFSCQLKYYHHYSRITKSDGFTLELWNFGDWIFL